MKNHIPKPLTRQQQKALHKYFELVSEELNAAGYTIQKTLAQSIELDWEPAMVKEMIWRPIQKALLGKHSTTTLSKHMEIDLIYEHINRFLGEKLHMESIPFPHLEEGEADKNGRIKINNY